MKRGGGCIRRLLRRNWERGMGWGKEIAAVKRKRGEFGKKRFDTDGASGRQKRGVSREGFIVSGSRATTSVVGTERRVDTRIGGRDRKLLILGKKGKHIKD